MAEIKIEKKRTIWPWILLAILVVAFLIYYFGFRDSESNEPVAQMTSDTATMRSSEVDNYVQFISTGDTMGLDHRFTNEALLRLTSAVEAKAQQVEVDIATDLDQVREHARNITQEPFETSHANSIRKAADMLTSAMRKIQESKFTNLGSEMTDVQNAANSIKPEVLTLNQRDEVKSFFRESSDLLQSMN